MEGQHEVLPLEQCKFYEDFAIAPKDANLILAERRAQAEAEHGSCELEEIAVAQSLHQKLTEDQDDFLKSVMEARRGSGGSRYLGWYPTLFYTTREDSGEQDHLVADVHTDTPSAEHGHRGGILHLGVGDVNLGFLIVEGVMYAGPVFSSYEFVTAINERLTDDEFSQRGDDMDAPLWTRESFLVSRNEEET